jgi:hypothetical protein
MRTISTLSFLFVIISVFATSAFLYLNQDYNVSALLTIASVIALAAWIKNTGVLEDKKQAQA